MPKPSVQGLPLHTRSLTVAISRQSEKLWHARGDVIDLRKNGFVPTGHAIQPSGIIHMMSIDVDFDPKTLVMHEIEIQQPFIAIQPSKATGGECCRDPAPRLLELRGEALDDGFAKRLGTHFGGPLGCSHLLTLFQLMAPTIRRAVDLEQTRFEREGTENDPGDRFFRRSVFVDGHEKDAHTIRVTVQLADTHTRPIDPGDRVMERLETSHEVKTLVDVDRKRFMIERLELRERLRRTETLGSASWISHDERVAGLVGAPLIPGLAGRLFETLGGEPALEPLLDNLLQLAPGFIQITAALMDEFFERREEDDPSGEKQKPAVASVGGTTNSCYMWRDASPIQRA